MIKSDKTSQDIRFCDPNIIEELDKSKRYEIEKPEIKFTISETLLEYGKKAAAINGFMNLVFEGEGTEIYMVSETVSQNGSNNSSERHRRKIEHENTTGKPFNAVFEVSKLKMLSDDYEVRIAAAGGAQFTSKNREYTFFAALQQPVTGLKEE